MIHQAQFQTKLRLFQRAQQNSEIFAIQLLRFPPDSLLEKFEISDATLIEIHDLLCFEKTKQNKKLIFSDDLILGPLVKIKG